MCLSVCVYMHLCTYVIMNKFAIVVIHYSPLKKKKKKKKIRRLSLTWVLAMEQLVGW